MSGVGNESLVKFALTYCLEYKWAVFPVFGVREIEGRLVCSCGAGPQCSPSNMGKHPATQHGHKDAVSLAEHGREVVERRVHAWWGARPDANIGLATGKVSGVFVVDVDVKSGDGPASLAEWWKSVGVPGWDTLTARSGSGGQHYFFTYPMDGLALPGRGGWLPSVDVKSDGGYVVAAPSRIPAGDYRWTTDGVVPGVPPQALLDAIRSGDGNLPGAGGGGGYAPSIDDMVMLLNGPSRGERNDCFFHFALKWLRQHRGDEKIVLGLLRIAWERMDDKGDFTLDEVAKAYRSARGRYVQQGVADEDWAEALARWSQAGPAGSGGGGVVDGEPPAPSPLDVTSVEGGVVTAPDGFPLTDVGNSERLVTRFGDLIRHTDGTGWHVWDGSRWNRGSAEKLVEGYAEQVIRYLLVDLVPKMHERGVADEAVKRVMSFWRTSETAGRVSASVRLSAKRVNMPFDRWDASDWILNCVNGTLDLRDGSFYEHRKNDYLTKLCGAVWEGPDVGCPRWEAFLRRMLPDAGLRRYVQKAVGYSLRGGVDEKVMFMLYGEGNNGKTMFTETVGALLGEYWAVAPKSVFIGYGTKSEQHPTDLAGVAGARFVTCGEEVKPTDTLAEGRIKSMTGGNSMKARFMHQDFFEFTFKGKLWLDTNYVPKLTDFSPALQERLRLLPWTTVIPVEERRGRSEVFAEFMSELSGVLAWAVEGARLWREEGLGVPEVVSAATTEYVRDENLVAQFCEDYLEPGGFCSARDMRNAYVYWMSEQGHDVRYVLSARNLGTALKQSGFAQARGPDASRGWNARIRVAVPQWV